MAKLNLDLRSMWNSEPSGPSCEGWVYVYVCGGGGGGVESGY